MNEHGVSGLNVNPGAPEEIADAVQRICEDPYMYEKYSMGALYRYHRLFTLDAMTDGLVKHYKKVLEE